jgi:hypothetical protein
MLAWRRKLSAGRACVKSPLKVVMPPSARRRRVFASAPQGLVAAPVLVAQAVGRFRLTGADAPGIVLSAFRLARKMACQPMPCTATDPADGLVFHGSFFPM